MQLPVPSTDATPMPFPLPEDGRRARVLIVDDEPNIRTVLRVALKPEGYELAEAADGAEALERFADWPPDVVVSDLLMPRMNGTCLLREARGRDDAVGFILLTGVGTVADAVEALRLGADDYLLKPFHVDEVLLAVRRALRHRVLVRQNRFYQNVLEERVAELALQVEQLTVDALLTIANAVEARDGYTGGHVERVTRYAVAAGRKLGMRGERLRGVWVAGLLHDIGKIGVPDTILKKPDELTPDEFEVMKRHPRIGAAILERSAFLRPAVEGVLHHHERWDGRGYPDGLRGEEIPLEGRILAVADAYDAIVTTRAYRDRRDPPAAVEELRRCAGTQFDPQVVEAFLAAMEEGFVQDPSLPEFPVHGLLAARELLAVP